MLGIAEAGLLEMVDLHRNKKATVTQLINNAELNQRTTYSALDKLTAQNLIRQDVSNGGFPLHKYYELTDKGKPVARGLNRVDKLLE